MISAPIQIRRFPPCSARAINYVTSEQQHGVLACTPGGGIRRDSYDTSHPARSPASQTMPRGHRKRTKKCIFSGDKRLSAHGPYARPGHPRARHQDVSAHPSPGLWQTAGPEGRHGVPLSRARIQSVLLRSSAHNYFLSPVYVRSFNISN